MVTHNGPIRAVHAHVFGVGYAQNRQSAKSIKKGSLSAVRLENGVWTAVASGIPAWSRMSCSRSSLPPLELDRDSSDTCDRHRALSPFTTLPAG